MHTDSTTCDIHTTAQVKVSTPTCTVLVPCKYSYVCTCKCTYMVPTRGVIMLGQPANRQSWQTSSDGGKHPSTRHIWLNIHFYRTQYIELIFKFVFLSQNPQSRQTTRCRRWLQRAILIGCFTKLSLYGISYHFGNLSQIFNFKLLVRRN